MVRDKLLRVIPGPANSYAVAGGRGANSDDVPIARLGSETAKSL